MNNSFFPRLSRHRPWFSHPSIKSLAFTCLSVLKCHITTGSTPSRLSLSLSLSSEALMIQFLTAPAAAAQEFFPKLYTQQRIGL